MVQGGQHPWGTRAACGRGYHTTGLRADGKPFQRANDAAADGARAGLGGGASDKGGNMNGDTEE